MAVTVGTTRMDTDSFISNIWLPELWERAGHDFNMSLDGTLLKIWCSCEPPVSWEQDCLDPAAAFSRYAVRFTVVTGFLNHPAVYGHLGER